MVDEKRNATRLSNRAGTIGERLSDWNTKKDLSAPYRGLHAFGELS